MTIDPHTMPLDAIRDWHYRRKALAELGKPLSEMTWALQFFDYGHCRRLDKHGKKNKQSGLSHPFPATLDGAASALLEGWEWKTSGLIKYYDDGTVGFEESWVARKNEAVVVSCPRTDDEIRDRYLLWMLAKLKEAGQ
jgi:hypothetical protein